MVISKKPFYSNCWLYAIKFKLKHWNYTRIKFLSNEYVRIIRRANFKKGEKWYPTIFHMFLYQFDKNSNASIVRQFLPYNEKSHNIVFFKGEVFAENITTQVLHYIDYLYFSLKELGYKEKEIVNFLDKYITYFSHGSRLNLFRAIWDVDTSQEVYEILETENTKA